MLADLLAALAPATCLACRFPLAAPGLCAPCRGELPWLRDPCPRCALPRTGGRCTACPARTAAFRRAWAPLAHAGPARELVLALKTRGALSAVDVMAAPMAAGVPPELLAGATLVPVPAAAARRRRRGFDPAGALADAVAARTGRPVLRCLRRTGSGARQVGRGRRERRSGVEIAAHGPAPPVALLVDDVHTTGATLDACARALRAAGSAQVAGVTFVRTLTSA